MSLSCRTCTKNVMHQLEQLTTILNYSIFNFTSDCIIFGNIENQKYYESLWSRTVDLQVNLYRHHNNHNNNNNSDWRFLRTVLYNDFHRLTIVLSALLYHLSLSFISFSFSYITRRCSSIFIDFLTVYLRVMCLFLSCSWESLSFDFRYTYSLIVVEQRVNWHKKNIVCTRQAQIILRLDCCIGFYMNIK